jgi:hypothetical protein
VRELEGEHLKKVGSDLVLGLFGRWSTVFSTILKKVGSDQVFGVLW